MKAHALIAFLVLGSALSAARIADIVLAARFAADGCRISARIDAVPV